MDVKTTLRPSIPWLYKRPVFLLLMGCSAGDVEQVDGVVDTGSMSAPASMAWTPVPSDGSCLAGIVPMLPGSPRGVEDAWLVLASGTASCSADTWQLTASGAGYPLDGFHGLDVVTFQAWDLESGQLVDAFDGELIDHYDPGYVRSEQWGVEVMNHAELPCTTAPHLAFTATGRQGDDRVIPASILNADSEVTWISISSPDARGRWSLQIEAGSSDEVWVWATYPDTEEMWGPFAVLDRAAGGAWVWEPDRTIRSVVGVDGASFAVIGCTGGVPLGTTTVSGFDWP